MRTAAVNQKKYGRLLLRVLPGPISSEEEYDQLVGLAGQLIGKGETLSPEEGKLLELLGILVADYDERHYPLGENDPVTTLKELMDFRDLQPKDLWSVLGSKGAVSEILNGKRAISKAQARKLAAFFHVPADLFI